MKCFTKVIYGGVFSMMVYGLILASGISCTDDSVESDLRMADPVRISPSGADVEGPYFVSDHRGFPVLVWSEKAEGSEGAGFLVRYARFSKKGDKLLAEGEVSPSAGCSVTSESMNKIAFKSDGTMVSVYSRRQPTEENRFAGALYYSQSFDDGKTWTSENYLHSGDTTRGLSRSFFDLARLPDGEVGAVWLDSRLTATRGDGSTLFFSKTSGNFGFLKDQPVDSGTCECCRTNLFVAQNGDIHILYRDIWNDSIRDISHVVSEDNGKTFAGPTRISRDNWVIFGCPHTGPSMGETSEGLMIAWFTQGGGPGVYHTLYDVKTRTYTRKELLTREGTHPQLLTTEDEATIFLWEESGAGSSHAHSMDSGTPMVTLSMDDLTSPRSVIKARVWKEGRPVREHWVSSTDQFSTVPVGISLPDGFVGIAWLQQNEDGSSSVMYRRIKG